MSDAERYLGYEEWKGWVELFHYSNDQADQFSGECRDVRIANADVLEMGFGSGSFLQWARDCGARVSGTEVNPALVLEAKARGINVIESDIREVAERDPERFDTIVAFDVFEHLTFDEIVGQLRAAERALKPGGSLLLRFPNTQSPFGSIPQYGDSTHRTHLSRGIVEQAIRGTSLVIMRYERAYRARGRSPAVKIVRFLRHLLFDLMSAILGFALATRIPWDPVAVVVLRKPGQRS